MRILITGATGFIGRRLAARLAAGGHTITGLSRNPETAAARVPAISRFFPWQTADAPPPAALADVDAVVHLAGETVDGRWTAAKKQRILNSRVDGTRNLVVALTTSGRTPALICTSAVGYYGDRGDEELTEESASGGGFLAEVCRNWEREALAAEQAGCRVTRLRLGIVLGAEGGALARILPLARLGLGGRLGSGRQWWPWVHIDDVAGAFEAAALNPWSGAFNVTAPQPVRQRDFAGALARALHRPALAPPAPAFALRLGLGEFADELLFSKRVLPEHLRQAGFDFSFPSVDDALVQLVTEEARRAQLPSHA